jgi:hypothetical protein
MLRALTTTGDMPAKMGSLLLTTKDASIWESAVQLDARQLVNGEKVGPLAATLMGHLLGSLVLIEMSLTLCEAGASILGPTTKGSTTSQSDTGGFVGVDIGYKVCPLVGEMVGGYLGRDVCASLGPEVGA